MRRAERPGPGQNDIGAEAQKAAEKAEADKIAAEQAAVDAKTAQADADKLADEQKAKDDEVKAKEEADKKTAEIIAEIDKRIKGLNERVNYVTGKVD